MWLQKMRSGVDELVFSRDGRFLYTLDTSRAITVWDVLTHSGTRIDSAPYLQRWATRGIHPLANGMLLIRNQQFLVLNANGKLATIPVPLELNNKFAQILDDGEICYVREPWRSIVKCQLGSLQPKQIFALAETKKAMMSWPEITKFNLAQDGRSVAILFAGGAVAYFVLDAEGQPLTHTTLDIAQAYRVKLSPDGKTLIVFSNESERFSLWDVDSGSWRVSGVKCSMPWGLFAFNPMYPVFAMCQSDGTLAIWSTENGRPIRSLDFALGNHIRDVAFSPDGLTCAVGGSNKQFVVFDVDV